jgi:hypothetical protein
MARYDLPKKETLMEATTVRRMAEGLLAEHRTGIPFKSFLPQGLDLGCL